MSGPAAPGGIAPVGLTKALNRIDQIGSRIREIDPAWEGAWLNATAGPGRPLTTGSNSYGVGGDPFGAATNASSTPLGALGALDTTGSLGAGGLAAGGLSSILASLGAQTVSTSASPLGMGPENGLLAAPVRGARLTQDFGPSGLSLEPSATVDGVHYDHFHDGLDLAAPLGRPVTAAAAGQVVFAGRTSDGAVVVRIAHNDGSETRYGHLGAGLDVQAGDWVGAGDQIGVVGLTGNTTGPHLHFELWRGGQSVDPAPWIDGGQIPGAAGYANVIGGPTASVRSAAVLARFDAVADQIPYAPEIRAAALEAGIDPLLLASLVRAESNFRPDAVSRAGAMGLTQLMPATAKSLNVADPFDPAENLRAGAKYIGANLRIYGRVDLALAAYQAGKGAVRAAGGIPDSPTTHNYIDTILRTWSGYTEAIP